jgi:hypothetical protein
MLTEYWLVVSPFSCCGAADAVEPVGEAAATDPAGVATGVATGVAAGVADGEVDGELLLFEPQALKVTAIAATTAMDKTFTAFFM